MTTSAPIPAADTAPIMANPSDTASEASPEQAPAQARAAIAARPSLRAQVAENPLLSFFGLVIVALLTAAIVSPHIRIDDINVRIDDTNRRIDDTNARIDRLEAKMDARFDKLEAAVEAIDRKLTALIAHLNATTAVDDALAGRLTGPSSPDASDAQVAHDQRFEQEPQRLQVGQERPTVS